MDRKLSNLRSTNVDNELLTDKLDLSAAAESKRREECYEMSISALRPPKFLTLSLLLPPQPDSPTQTIAMSLNLSNPELNSFLRKIQLVWRKNNSTSSESWEQNARRFDLSPTEASTARLIAFQERNDNTSFLREWAAFLGPNGHLSSSSDSQIGQQIMALVREGASAFGLVNVAGSIVVLDPVRVGGETEVEGGNDAAENKGGEGAAQHDEQAENASKDAGWGDSGMGAPETSGEPAQPQSGW